MRDAAKDLIPHPSIRRLPSYLRLLRTLLSGGEAGETRVSCTAIARELGLDSTQVRKDLALTGISGRPRVGYELRSLIRAIEEFLGWVAPADAFLAGAGNLGRALIGYDGFRRCGLNIAGVFDIDNAKIGGEVSGIRVQHLRKMPELARRAGVGLGVITVPAAAAQEVAGVMAESGIGGIWNFAPVRLELPKRIRVENVELASSFAVLSVGMRRRRG